MKMRLIVFAALIACASAQMFGMPPQRQNPGMQSPNGANGIFGGQDPNQIMTIVRQILMRLIPILMKNPALMQALGGGNGMNPVGGGGAAQPPAPPAPPANPPAPSVTGPGTFPIPPQHHAGGFGGGMGGPGGMGGGMGGMPGPMPFGMSGSDKLKDRRLFDLLYDVRTGAPRDPGLQRVLPRVMPNQGMPWGWSLPDMYKDQVVHYFANKIWRRGNQPLPQEREIIGLIGDPAEMLPSIFGAGAGMGGAYGQPGAGPGGFVPHTHPFDPNFQGNVQPQW